jgi:hypothetical protein
MADPAGQVAPGSTDAAHLAPILNDLRSLQGEELERRIQELHEQFTAAQAPAVEGSKAEIAAPMELDNAVSPLQGPHMILCWAFIPVTPLACEAVDKTSALQEHIRSTFVVKGDMAVNVAYKPYEGF